MDCVTQVPGSLTSTGAQPTEGGRTRIWLCLPLSLHPPALLDLNVDSAVFLYSPALPSDATNTVPSPGSFLVATSSNDSHFRNL